MPTLADMAVMTVASAPGTGAVTLGVAVADYQTFVAAGIANGASISYRLSDVGGAWEIAAELFVPNVSRAAAVAMAWQAEAAGPVLDKAVAGTFVDKAVVQKIAGKGGDAKDLGSLLVLPLALAAFERQPALMAQPRVRGLFRRVVRSNFESVALARIKERKRDERWQALAKEAGIPLYATDEEGNVLIGEDGKPLDAIDAMVSDLLALVAGVGAEA